MKCVKTVNGSIMRVKDQEAAELVDNVDYFYCPKWEWKVQEGKEYRGDKHGG
jgi:hypothetical protein